MSIQSPNSYYAPNVGVGYENVEIPHVDTRAPTVYDYKYPLGKRWIDQQGVASYALCSVSSVGGEMQAVWIADGGSAVGVSSIATQSGSATPASGVITINGDAGVNVLTSASGSTVVVALDANPQATSFTATYVNTLLTGSKALGLYQNQIEGAGSNANVDVVVLPKGTGNLAVQTGNLNLQSASSKLLINATTSASASCGSATLVAGTVTVATTAVTASSLIFLTVAALGTVTTAQAVCVSAQTAGTSFVITSADNTDTSVVNYLIIN